MKEKTTIAFVSGVWSSAMLEMTSSIALPAVGISVPDSGLFPIITGMVAGTVLAGYCFLQAQQEKMLSKAQPGG